MSGTARNVTGAAASIRSDICAYARPLLLVHLAASMAFIALFSAWAWTDVPIDDLTRDTLSVAEYRLMLVDQVRGAMGGTTQFNVQLPMPEGTGLEMLNSIDLTTHPYFGLLSNLGILLWCGTGAIAVFAAVVSRPSNPREGLTLCLFGLFSWLLMIDDFFLIHERVMPHYLGLPEVLVLGVYGVLFLILLVGWKKMLFRAWPLMFCAIVYLAVSLTVDQWPLNIPQSAFFEDGFKFAGICAWAAWHVVIARDVLQMQDYRCH